MHAVCDLAVEHLLLHLKPINRTLRWLANQQKAVASQLDRPDLAHLCITDSHVEQLMTRVDCLPVAVASELCFLHESEQRAEQLIRERSHATKTPLPLDLLTESLSLSECELRGLVACAAIEVDHGYEGIFAYIMDDLNCRYPSVELLCRINSSHFMEQRVTFGRFGRLRQSRLLDTFGEPASDARTQLRLGEGVIEFLLGANLAMTGAWEDPAHRSSGDVDDSPDNAKLKRIGRAISNRSVDLVGLWGDSEVDSQVAANVIAKFANQRLRRFHRQESVSLGKAIRSALHDTSVRNAILQIDADQLLADAPPDALDELVRALSVCSVPIVVTGVNPWRSTDLLAARSYVDVQLSAVSCSQRATQWRKQFPELDEGRLRELASRFRMSRQELVAVSTLARNIARIESNGSPAKVTDQIETACAAVAAKRSGRFLNAVQCRRGPEDLVVPPELYKQVMEIAAFTDVLPHVSDDWGFGRIATGNLGMKCLFTGDPGTGKTLAAEVIASLVGTPLLKVNLAELVSKWVGETEKNLDAAFDDATSSHSILFFDEADALFGKRGEVKQGVDRYANLEVSHLLQRLEEHRGLVILASNLKNNIDVAFLRRFQSVLHFPRPTESERKRIWGIAFPDEAPLATNIDLAQLARLDLTGAGIVAAARTAALIAASHARESIDINDVVRGITRQFRQEGRVLSPKDLGEYASLLMEST